MYAYVNYYYSDELTEDPEGNLVMLCQDCSDKNEELIQWAQTGDQYASCELCDAFQDETDTEPCYG